jgi:hypothetical protein
MRMEGRPLNTAGTIGVSYLLVCLVVVSILDLDVNKTMDDLSEFEMRKVDFRIRGRTPNKHGLENTHSSSL